MDKESTDLKKITDTIEVKLANILEDSGYKDHEDMDGEDFAMLKGFILDLIKEEQTEILKELVQNCDSGDVTKDGFYYQGTIHRTDITNYAYEKGLYDDLIKELQDNG